MPTQKRPPRPPDPEAMPPYKVPAEIGREIEKAMEALGLDLENETDRATGWRLTSGNASVKAAMRAIRAVEDKSAETGTPVRLPSLVIYATDEMRSWIEIGEQLSRLSAEQFGKQLTKIRALVESIENASSDDLDGTLHPTRRR